MSELKPENAELVERILGLPRALLTLFYRHELDRLLDAARAEGPRPKPSQEAVERLGVWSTKLDVLGCTALESYAAAKSFAADLRALLASFSDAPSDGGA